MARLRRWTSGGLFGAMVAVVWGCSPNVETTSELGATTSGGVSEMSGSDATTSGESSGRATTGADASVGSSTGGEDSASTGGEDSSTGVPSTCEATEAGVWMLLDYEPPADVFEVTIDAPCSVVGAEDVSSMTVHYTLHCDEGDPEPMEYVLQLWSSNADARPLVLDETIRLRTHRNYPIDYGLVSATLLTTLEGERIAGSYRWPSNVPAQVDAWFDVTVEPFDVGCSTEEPEPQGSFINDPCPRSSTRLGANIVWGGDAVSVSPGERVPVGDLVYSADIVDLQYVDQACSANGPQGLVSFSRSVP